MQQHAESVHGFQTARRRVGEKRRDEGGIDDIGDNRFFGQKGKPQILELRTVHANGAGIDKKMRFLSEIGKVPNILPEKIGFQCLSEFIGKRFGKFPVLVEYAYWRKAAFFQAQNDGTRAATGTDNERGTRIFVPIGRPVVEIGDKTEPVGIGAKKDSLLDDHRVDVAEYERHWIDIVAELQHGMLVRYSDVAADIIARA